MTETIRDLMTTELVCLDSAASCLDAATRMRDAAIGDVIVTEDDRVCGILTDRDIVVRCVAEGGDPAKTSIGSLCSREVATLEPDAAVGEAIRLMEEKAIRRIPVVEGDRPVGVVSIGDLAVARDRESALGRISAAAPNA